MNSLHEDSRWFFTGLLGGAGCLLACLTIALLAAFYGFGPRLLPQPPRLAPVTVASITHTPTAAPGTPPLALTPSPAHPLTPSPTPVSSSPWGTIVYTCFNGGFDDVCALDVASVADAEPRRLTASPATDFYPELGPRGDLVVFSSRRSGAFRIYLMDPDGGNVRQVGPDSGSHFAPDVSPDGTQIVFANASEGAAGRRQHIWIMNLDGSDPRPLTGGPYNDVDPVWSPDGRHIAFASDRGWRPAHWIMDADGQNMRMLPDDVPEHGGRSDWSPDGQWLAFYAGPRERRDIYLVATDGSGDSRRLTYSGRNLAPAYSPDGQWIVFTSYREDDNANLFIMRPDGSDVRQLTTNPRPDWQPRWGP